jgi:hypothetical protein
VKISLSQLADINERFEDAAAHLRAQQSLALNFDGERNYQALMTLLSTGLRIFCWLEAQKRDAQEQRVKSFQTRTA